MSDVYFVRIRGRVRGPVDAHQLRKMAQRGQVSRAHEISTDGTTWSSAAAYIERATAIANQLDLGPDEITIPADVPEIGADSIVQPSFVRRGGKSTSTLKGSLLVWLVAGAGVAVSAVAAAYAIDLGGLRTKLSSLGESREVRVTPEDSSSLNVKSPDDSKTSKRITTSTSPSAIQANNGDVASGFVNSVKNHEALARSVALVAVGREIIDYDGQRFELATGTGSAFVIGEDGYLLTNRHVVDDFVNFARAEKQKRDLLEKQNIKVNERLWVFLGGEKFSGEVVFVDSAQDFAIIKIPHKCEIRFRLRSDTKSLLDEDVRAVGFPDVSQEGYSDEEKLLAAVRRWLNKSRFKDVREQFKDRDFQYTITNGRISQVTRDGATSTDWLQHTASITPGNSGGPLVTTDGVIVGINTQFGATKRGEVNFVSSRALAIAQLRERIDAHVKDAEWQE